MPIVCFFSRIFALFLLFVCCRAGAFCIREYACKKSSHNADFIARPLRVGLESLIFFINFFDYY